jgi:hypothetical protein
MEHAWNPCAQRLVERIQRSACHDNPQAFQGKTTWHVGLIENPWDDVLGEIW